MFLLKPPVETAYIVLPEEAIKKFSLSELERIIFERLL